MYGYSTLAAPSSSLKYLLEAVLGGTKNISPLFRWTIPIYIVELKLSVSDYPLFFIEVRNVVIEILILCLIFGDENDNSLNWKPVQVLKVSSKAHIQVVKIVG